MNKLPLPPVVCPFCGGPTLEAARTADNPACPRCGALFEFGLLPAEARQRLAERLGKRADEITIGVSLLPGDFLCVTGWETEELVTVLQLVEVTGLKRPDLVRRVARGDFPGAEKVPEGKRLRGVTAPWYIPRSAVIAWRNQPRKPRGGGSYPAKKGSRTDGRLKKNRAATE